MALTIQNSPWHQNVPVVLRGHLFLPVKVHPDENLLKATRLGRVFRPDKFSCAAVGRRQNSDDQGSSKRASTLQKLMQAEWTPHPRLAPAGDSILGGLVSKGWIECQSFDDGLSCYRITEQGRLAFKLPIP
jgi:hypothetical protein